MAAMRACFGWPSPAGAAPIGAGRHRQGQRLLQHQGTVPVAVGLAEPGLGEGPGLVEQDPAVAIGIDPAEHRRRTTRPVARPAGRRLPAGTLGTGTLGSGTLGSGTLGGRGGRRRGLRQHRQRGAGQQRAAKQRQTNGLHRVCHLITPYAATPKMGRPCNRRMTGPRRMGEEA